MFLCCAAAAVYISPCFVTAQRGQCCGILSQIEQDCCTSSDQSLRPRRDAGDALHMSGRQLQLALVVGPNLLRLIFSDLLFFFLSVLLCRVPRALPTVCEDLCCRHSRDDSQCLMRYH